MKVSSAILLLLAWNCSTTAVGQTLGQTIGDLPLPIANNILTILINGTVQLTGNCTDVSDVSQVQYWLYTRQNPNSPIILNTLDSISTSKPLIILIHGWNSDPNADSMTAIRNAYLQRYDCNLIAVDHSVYASLDYQTAYCYAPSIGLNVAQFLCNISSALNVNLLNVHLVGHSLGAHISGFAGSATQNTCGILGRITGLDPAGPLFQDINTSQRLDKSDAKIVDVMHTNQGEFGYAGDLGDVDFYPNCGSIQPGCLNIVVTSLADIENVLVSTIACSHGRSCFLFAESVNSNAFFSTSCLVCGLPICLADSIFHATYTYMGESCRSQPPSTEYVLTTNAQSPYARGPQGPLN